MRNPARERSLAEPDTGEGGMRSEVRRLVSGVNLAVLVLAILAGLCGAVDSMTDAGGDRFWGNLTIAAPGVYAGWCMLEPAVRKSTDIRTVLLRMVPACLIAPAFVAIPVGAAVGIAVLFPGVRDLIAAAEAGNGGFHYYWSEGVVSQVLLVPLGGWVVGACIALGVCLIIALPVLSLRSPGTVATGSHIESVNGAKRDSTAAFVFCGLGATIAGIVLWVFGDGGSILEVPRALGRVADALSSGVVLWDEAAWLGGVLLVVLGLIGMGWGCGRVLRARSDASDH